MIQECIEIFKENLNKRGERYVLDNYIPKDGTYILIPMEGEVWKPEEPLTIYFDKKKDKVEGDDSPKYSFLCYLDYYSKLIEMNKPVDPKKVIHSNNYFTFFIKKESLSGQKLTRESFDGYYHALTFPDLKYNKSNKTKGLLLYQRVEESLGKVNKEELDLIRKWIEENIFNELTLDIDTEGKDYLKLFFVYPDQEKTKEAYRREGQRYILPNIYNSNDYNLTVNDQIMGLPSNNLNMNAKKPYLANHSRRVPTPYLLNQKDALLQVKFYDFLMGCASKRKTNIYFDYENKKIEAILPSKHPTNTLRGYFLRIQKGKNEVEIQYADTVIRYNPNLIPAFNYIPILTVNQGAEVYGMVNKREELEKKINEVFFNKSLTWNYFTKPEEMNIKDGTVLNQIIAVRSRLFSWFYLENGIHILPLFQKTGSILIKNSVCCGYWKKARHQINLLWSLEDYLNGNKRREENMNQIVEQFKNHMNQKEEWEFSSDQEYFFAVGQLVSYFISQSKSKKKPLSFVNPFINARNTDMIKKHLTVLFKKYNYDIEYQNMRVKRLYSNVMLYEPESTAVDTMMISAGVTANNLIFAKTKNEKDSSDTAENNQEVNLQDENQ